MFWLGDCAAFLNKSGTRVTTRIPRLGCPTETSPWMSCPIMIPKASTDHFHLYSERFGRYEPGLLALLGTGSYKPGLLASLQTEQGRLNDFPFVDAWDPRTCLPWIPGATPPRLNGRPVVRRGQSFRLQLQLSATQLGRSRRGTGRSRARPARPSR